MRRRPIGEGSMAKHGIDRRRGWQSKADATREPVRLLREIHASVETEVMDSQDEVLEVVGLDTVGAVLVDRKDNGWLTNTGT